MQCSHYVETPADQITLPLGKALSILELFVMDLPIDQANAGYVVMDLIREAEAVVARVFDDKPTFSKSTENSKATINESLEFLNQAMDVLQCHLGELRQEVAS